MVRLVFDRASAYSNYLDRRNSETSRSTLEAFLRAFSRSRLGEITLPRSAKREKGNNGSISFEFTVKVIIYIYIM